MREELQQLLREFDYASAYAWFAQHVPGKYFIKELLSKGEDPYNRAKLIGELRAIEESFAPAPKQNTVTPPKEVSPILVQQAAPTLNESLLDEEWKPKFKEANHWFETIGYMATAEERKTAAFRILDLMDEVEEAWHTKDFMKQYGQAPDFESQGIEQLSIPQMTTRITTLRTYISKANKGKLNKDSIPKWEAEKAELERRVRQ